MPRQLFLRHSMHAPNLTTTMIKKPDGTSQDKKLCCRQETARCAVSVETVRNVTQMFVNLH